MDRLFIALGGISACLGVGLGAFGAHALKSKLTPELVTVYQTGVQYHLIHAVGLVLVGILVHWLPDCWPFKAAGWLLLVGIILFSGSLYLLVITEIRYLGLITPLGGVAFIVGWACLAFGAYFGGR